MRNSKLAWPTGAQHKPTSSFVEDGYSRALKSINDAIREEVEQEYADAWNTAGLWKRWKLHREMESEISRRVAKQADQISPYSLF